jgi:drug/metabolite transporter (DMT)-like permease
MVRKKCELVLKRKAAKDERMKLIAAGVTVVLWASAFVFVRAVGHDYSPGALALGRQLTGSTALTVFVLLRHSGFPTLPGRKVLLPVLAWGAAWFGLYNLALNSAEQHLDAGTTALLVNLAPVLIGVLAGVLLGEGFPARLMIGLGVAFAGVLLIAATTSDGQRDLTGVLMGLAAALLYAGAATTQKRLLTSIDPLTMTWLGCLAGTVLCLPFTLDLIDAASTAPASSTLGILYLGVFPTAIAFLTWGYALSKSSAGRLAASTYAIPPLVILISWLTLGEIPLPLALLGGALCLTGVALATLRPTKKVPEMAA